MKGYPISNGYMGYVPSKGSYQRFETEGAYVEWYRETQIEISFCDYLLLKENEV